MSFKLNQDRRHCIPRQKHWVTDAAAYDAALRQRGSLTVWFTAEARAAPRTTPGSRDLDRWAARSHPMQRLRMLITAIVLGAIAGPAGAEDFWGRAIADQPSNFIFGYGSLVDTASRDATAKKPIPALPARVGAAFGYVRCWCSRSPSGFTALGLRRPAPGETAMTINGVLYPVEGNDMAAFDKREGGYARVEVPRDQIQAVSWQRLPDQGKIWVYVPVVEGHEPGVGLPAPTSAFPLLESYIDVVVEGGLEYGPDYAREIIATTTDWSAYWLNDRELPRRPWVFDKQSSAVDKILAATAPHFRDRMFPEEYAAERMGQK